MLDEETKARILPQRIRIIELLRNSGEKGVTNAVLNSISFRYTAHLSELRTYGYKIEEEDLGGGLSNYVLTYEPLEVQPKLERAIDVFWSIVNDLPGEEISKDELHEILEYNKFNIVRNWGANL